MQTVYDMYTKVYPKRLLSTYETARLKTYKGNIVILIALRTSNLIF